jgi:uncharacterized protein YjbJ (UPF0337 family)
MSDEHIRASVSHAQGAVEQVVGTLIRDPNMQRLGKARHAQGSAQQRLGNVQDTLGGTRTGMNRATLAAALLGALLLVVAMRAFGGGKSADANAALGAGI